jgi:hypothetical protein
LAITDEELREWWPNWEVEQPKAGLVHTEIFGVLTPIQELWDRVFGDGPHSDFKRVYRPLIADLHDDVLTVTTQPADPGAPSFTLNYKGG